MPIGLGAYLESKAAVPEFKHTFNYYTIRLKKSRDQIQNKLKEAGMVTAINYPLSLHLQEVYQDLGYKLGDFPIAEKAQSEVLSLPMYPELSRAQIGIVEGILRHA